MWKIVTESSRDTAWASVVLHYTGLESSKGTKVKGYLMDIAFMLEGWEGQELGGTKTKHTESASVPDVLSECGGGRRFKAPSTTSHKERTYG